MREFWALSTCAKEAVGEEPQSLARSALERIDKMYATEQGVGGPLPPPG